MLFLSSCLMCLLSADTSENALLHAGDDPSPLQVQTYGFSPRCANLVICREGVLGYKVMKVPVCVRMWSFRLLDRANLLLHTWNKSFYHLPS